MLKYTLKNIVELLPYTMKYVIAMDSEVFGWKNFFYNLTWLELVELLSHPWWGENVKLLNMDVSNEGSMVLFFERVEH